MWARVRTCTCVCVCVGLTLLLSRVCHCHHISFPSTTIDSPFPPSHHPRTHKNNDEKTHLQTTEAICISPTESVTWSTSAHRQLQTFHHQPPPPPPPMASLHYRSPSKWWGRCSGFRSEGARSITSPRVSSLPLTYVLVCFFFIYIFSFFALFDVIVFFSFVYVLLLK